MRVNYKTADERAKLFHARMLLRLLFDKQEAMQICDGLSIAYGVRRRHVERVRAALMLRSMARKQVR